MVSAAENQTEISEPSPKIQKIHGNGVSEITPFFRVKRLSEKAISPSRGSPLSVSYDLFSAVETRVPAGGKALVPTDLSIAVSEGSYARIGTFQLESLHLFSGLALKHSIEVGAGVVDADYRGPVGVILFNHSDVDFEVKHGDRIAQLIIEIILTPEVTEVDDLDYSEITPFLRVKRLSEKAIVPSRASPLSAGYDLSSAVETKVPARGKALVPTDLSIAVPEGAYARIASRSGLALKHSIHVGAGVVEADYRGPVGVLLHNLSDVDFEVKHGDRIAQLIIQKIVTPEVTEVDDLDYSEITPFLRVKRLSEKAIVPSRASPLSAGYDLSSAVETKVPARGKALVPTDLSIAVPEGAYARIESRSGFSIEVGAGVVDADYRGPVGVLLHNLSDVDFEVKHGDRIAQMIIHISVTPEVTEVDDLDSTVRGSAGFGSTGV